MTHYSDSYTVAQLADAVRNAQAKYVPDVPVTAMTEAEMRLIVENQKEGWINQMVTRLSDAANVRGRTETDEANVVTVPGGSDGASLGVAFAVTGLKGYYLKCDRDITLKTNDPDSPDDTIALTANTALQWLEGEASCDFTVDVTEIYVTLAAGDDAELILEIWAPATTIAPELTPAPSPSPSPSPSASPSPSPSPSPSA